jgi:hypothetical protein
MRQMRMLYTALVAVVLAAGIFFGLPGGGPACVRELHRAAALAADAGRLAAGLPAFAALPPFGETRAPTAPWRVGVQAGHWRIGELPEELWRLRQNTGARRGTLSEAEVNLRIAELVVHDLQAAGIRAELLPATVPPGYRADAFVAVHADDGGRGAERGWKVAPPWRASDASRRLRDSIAGAYASWTGMPEDRYGVTFNMRGYYAFSWYRFLHAVAPSTPAAIIETGFISSREDRAVIAEDPERAARGITGGILAYLGTVGAPRPTSLVPAVYPPMRVAGSGAALRYLPGDGERVSGFLQPGTLVRPVGRNGDWVDLIVWGNYRVFGWTRTSDLVPAAGS